MLDPELQSSVQSIWQSFVDPTLNLRIVVSRAEVPANDDLILEIVLAGYDVIQMVCPCL